MGYLIAGCDQTPDPGPTPAEIKLAISSVTQFEGDESTTFKFKVSTNEAPAEAVSVDYATEEITAGFEQDFVASNGTLNIPAGAREAFIDIEIVVDTFKENDEQFKVILSNAQGATIQTAEGIGTIRNDDDFVFVPDEGYITPDNYVGYDLVWRDEFDGTELNLNDWTHELGASGWGNNELQYYTDRADNAYVSGGNLTIEAKRENFAGASYTSARLITAGKREFAFGRVDIRAILPEGQGIWPALWMLGANFWTVGWPACGEIDIMELVGHEPEKVHGTAHWGPQGQSWSYNKGGARSISGKFSDKYHVFSIIWEPGKIKWYVDDNLYFQLENSDVNGAYPFDQDFFFIFNVAVGGNWPGNPDATTTFPQKMVVDYIRVFQEK
ncbi:MAG: family 16 glycosylhydrolase [Bacteroidota bacterium]